MVYGPIRHLHSKWIRPILQLPKPTQDNRYDRCVCVCVWPANSACWRLHRLFPFVVKLFLRPHDAFGKHVFRLLARAEVDALQCSHQRLNTNQHQRYTEWIGLCSVSRPRQNSIGYMGDGFYRSKDTTKVLKEMLQKTKQTTKTTKYTCAQTIIYTKKDIHKVSTASPLVYTNMGWLGDGSHRGQGR